MNTKQKLQAKLAEQAALLDIINKGTATAEDTANMLKLQAEIDGLFALLDAEEAAAASKSAVDKKDIAKETKKKLSSDAEVRPVEKKNQELFDRLDKGDSSALKGLKSKIRDMSGGVEKKKEETRPDTTGPHHTRPDCEKRWLRMHAIATYSTRATATECLPMEQR